MQDYPFPATGKPYIPPSPARLRSQHGDGDLDSMLERVLLLGSRRSASTTPDRVLWVYPLTRSKKGHATRSSSNRARLAYLRGVAGKNREEEQNGPSIHQQLYEVESTLTAAG